MIEVVIGVLKKKDELLVAKRPPLKPYAGFWEFPGGKIEKNETPEGALERELQEELGVKIFSPQFLFQYTHAYPDKIVLLNIYLIKNFIGEPAAKEGQMLRFLPYAEIFSLPILDGNFSLLEKLKFYLH